MPLSHFDSHPHGDTISRVTNDIDNVTTAVNEALSPLLTTLLTVLGVLGLMFWLLFPLLAAVMLAGHHPLGRSLAIDAGDRPPQVQKPFRSPSGIGPAA